jgi:HPt (histidine-containing phosphotransfer) domain-containing protein
MGKILSRFRTICAPLAIVFLTAAFLGCGKPAGKQPGMAARYSSFRNIPGITQDEIKAIDALREQKKFFTYGATLSTELFFDKKDDRTKGFTALFCEWLTEFFEIPFAPVIYDRDNLIGGLEAGEIDFTGELTASDERRATWHMTETIAERPIRAFSIEGSVPLHEIARKHTPRYAFLTTANAVKPELVPGTFETVFVDGSFLALWLLKNGDADAFISRGTDEAILGAYYDVVATDFFPPVYESVSMSTHDTELRPIISAVQKMLHSGGTRYLTELYNQGYRDYLKHKLFVRLDDKELTYIKNNPVIPFLAEHDNYPISFYNTHENAWQGIAFDVINEIETLTGLSFNVANTRSAEWPMLLKMFEDGKAPMITELIHSEDNDERFLWPRNIIMTDQYALLSKSDHRNISINEIPFVKVGLMRDTVHASLFKSWFPGHLNTREYESLYHAFMAMERGEVDMIMSGLRHLLVMTNYWEHAGYKANVIFDSSYDSTFGFSLDEDEETLRSIVDKSLALIDTAGISGQWMRKTYDYRQKLAELRLPWLIGASVLLYVILTLLLVFFLRNRRGRETALPAPTETAAAGNSGSQADSASQVISKLEALGIDAVSTIARFDNDMDSYLRILQSFAKHTPTFIASASSFNDLNSYRIATHSLKGSTRGIGAGALGSMAEKLEHAAKQGDTAFIEANNKAFIETVEKFVASIAAFLQSIPGAQDSAKPEKDAPAPETLAALKQAAENFDMATLQEAIKKLDAYRYRSQPDLANWLKEKAGKSDFAAIAERVGGC